MGRHKTSDNLVPIGVGQIDGYRVKSVGTVALTKLDYLSYVIVGAQYQPVLQEVAQGQRSLSSVISILSSNSQQGL